VSTPPTLLVGYGTLYLCIITYNVVRQNSEMTKILLTRCSDSLSVNVPVAWTIRVRLTCINNNYKIVSK